MTELTVAFVAVPHNADDLTGRRFSDLVVLGAIATRPMRWLCRCACGNLTTSNGANLKARGVQSCGCLKSKAGDFARTHGLTHSPEHRAWTALRNRCQSRTNKDYHNYGGRGITVDPRWKRFENFLHDMGSRPSAEHTIDRIDVNGPYSPANCRWSKIDVQANNKRTCVYFEFRGRSLTIAQIARMAGINDGTLRHRIGRGWSVERAASTPPAHIPNFAVRSHRSLTPEPTAGNEPAQGITSTGKEPTT